MEGANALPHEANAQFSPQTLMQTLKHKHYYATMQQGIR